MRLRRRGASKGSSFAVAVAMVLWGCSNDGSELSDPTATVSAAPTSTANTGGSGDTADTSGTVDIADVDTSVAATATSDSTNSSGPAFSVVAVPDEGVPGLDSPDQFCSSWSRFGGSFQVISVASAFLAAEPDAAYVIEVAASPVVSSSFDGLLEAWPAELESEYDTNANIVFGPFAARSDDGVSALEAAGATDNDLAQLATAWITALEQRDPTTPEVALVLSSRLQTLVDAAAEAFAADHPTVFADPALVNEVATPLTDQYLAVTCPDQGSLSGGEVGG